MISVIVPIYNVELYLMRCINSLLCQTVESIEIILVDDGSTDTSKTICDEYAQNDTRIRVIHKPNGGLSDARNAGLAIATGQYIAFVDSDDWVAPDFLEMMLIAIQETNSDICECEVVRTREDICFEQKPNKVECYNTTQALSLLIQDRVFHQIVCNKLFRRECIDGITFPVGKINEDEFWTYQVFGRAKKVTKISDVLYYYYQRPDSIMGVGYNLKSLDALEAKQQRQNYLERTFPSLAGIGALNLYGSCIYQGQMAIKSLNPEDLSIAKKTINHIRKSISPKVKISISSSFKSTIIILLSKVNFWYTCRLRNRFL